MPVASSTPACHDLSSLAGWLANPTTGSLEAPCRRLLHPAVCNGLPNTLAQRSEDDFLSKAMIDGHLDRTTPPRTAASNGTGRSSTPSPPASTRRPAPPAPAD